MHLGNKMVKMLDLLSMRFRFHLGGEKSSKVRIPGLIIRPSVEAPIETSMSVRLVHLLFLSQ